MFLLAQKLITEPPIYHFKICLLAFFLCSTWGWCSFYFSRVQIWVAPRSRNIFHEGLMEMKNGVAFDILVLAHEKKLLGDYSYKKKMPAFQDSLVIIL